LFGNNVFQLRNGLLDDSNDSFNSVIPAFESSFIFARSTSSVTFTAISLKRQNRWFHGWNGFSRLYGWGGFRDGGTKGLILNDFIEGLMILILDRVLSC
jgi:hypothetical protein